MGVLDSVLAKAKSVVEALESDVEKGDLLAKAKELVSEVEAKAEEVEQAVASNADKEAVGADGKPGTELTPSPDGTPNAGAAAVTPPVGTTPEGSTTGPQPSDPANENVNMGGTGSPVVNPDAPVPGTVVSPDGPVTDTTSTQPVDSPAAATEGQPAGESAQPGVQTSSDLH